MKSRRIKKICLFSGKRGGFGAYMPLMQLIANDPKLELQILLGDMHTSTQFGGTEEEVCRYFPHAKIELIQMNTGRGDSPLVRTENLGTCLYQAAKILNKLKPDIVMAHGDRGDHLIIAFAALNLGLVVAHTQGGEVSGNIDEIQRHAITKLSHLHFPETQKAAQRIIKLGEEPSRVHVVGSLYIDRIVKKMYSSARKIRQIYGLSEKEKYFVVIFHPDTFLSPLDNYRQAKILFNALREYGLKSIITYPCSDPGYNGVVKAIAENKNDKHFLIFKNIDNLDFLGLMSEAEAIIGNSSSALVEAPYFHLPAINIGARQAGRDREENVVDVKADRESILKAIHFVLENKLFRKKLLKCGYRLGDGMAAEKILCVLKKLKINADLLKKRVTY